tara:strand:- start:941 stop:1927 length:987 start_codon:yes stop_codon:yes gene_type:complete
MEKNSIKKFLLILLGLLAVYWLYKSFAGPESFDYIISHKYKLFLLIPAHIPTLYFDSISWKILMKKNYLGTLWCVIITWISQTAGKVMPTGMVTGEFVRVYLSIKKGMKISEASSTVIGDLALASFSLVIISIISLIIIFFTNESFYLFKGSSIYLTFSIITLVIGSIFFCIIIRKRFLRKILKNFRFFTESKINKKLTHTLIKFDFELYKLSFRIKTVIFALFVRLLGWIGGAFEIYIFFLIIGVKVDIFDVIIIESFAGVMRAVAFFIPAGLGVQEFAFIVVGNFVGLSSPVAFAAAIGRRIREVLIGIPAIITWYVLFNRDSKIN